MSKTTTTGREDFDGQTPDGFDSPIATPGSEEDRQQWQEANRNWWEDHPMRYDWREALGVEEFSKEFYDEIDRRFFDAVRGYMPFKQIPFDNLVDFEGLRGKDVLEIGVGNGSHAQLLAGHAGTFNGVDLTNYAIHSTSERLKIRGVAENATLQRMDAEKLAFEDNSFDFVWSWGVIHHSSNTETIVKQIKRVLRPGGTFTAMVYHRNWWNFYVASGLMRGVLQGKLLKTRSLHQILQDACDGALARFYSIDEWKAMISPHLEVEHVEIQGAKTDIVLIPGSRFKDGLVKLFPDSIARFLTHNCKMGTFLISTMRKR